MTWQPPEPAIPAAGMRLYNTNQMQEAYEAGRKSAVSEPVAWTWDTKSQHDGFLDAHFQFSKPDSSPQILNLRPLYATPPAAVVSKPCGHVTSGYFALGEGRIVEYQDAQFKIPVYATPPAEAKPLTDEQIEKLWQGHVLIGAHPDQRLISPTVFARAIEAAHGIVNIGAKEQ